MAIQHDDETRRYERIDVELPCRLYVPGPGGHLRFEAFCTSRNLGLGGVFVASSFLLRQGLELWVELGLPDGPLAIRATVSHVESAPDEQRGMGIEFLDVDRHGRETLLRYFAPARYRAFHAAFLKEFPHLDQSHSLPEVALVLNLWEEWKLKAAEAAAAPDARPAARPAPRRGTRR